METLSCDHSSLSEGPRPHKARGGAARARFGALASRRPRPLRQKQAVRTAGTQPTLVRMKLIGARPGTRFTGDLELPGKSNYFLGNDPAEWRAGTPNFAQVARTGVYPGIDVLHYGAPQELECDFVVAPGANPSVIQIAYEGVEELTTDETGDLILRTPSGVLKQHAPKLYQDV
jgi:hypothetical protein